MIPPYEQEERYCDECESLMDKTDTYEWECPKCGFVLNTEPDWDSMKGGRDYDER